MPMLRSRCKYNDSSAMKISLELNRFILQKLEFVKLFTSYKVHFLSTNLSSLISKLNRILQTKFKPRFLQICAILCTEIFENRKTNFQLSCNTFTNRDFFYLLKKRLLIWNVIKSVRVMQLRI